MEIKHQINNGATIVQLAGSLDGNSVTDAQDKIFPLLTDKMCMVLDMSQCNYVSSAGLRLLLMVAKQVNSQCGALGLSGVSAEIKDVMDMTGFSNFFKVFDTVDEAVEAARKES